MKRSFRGRLGLVASALVLAACAGYSGSNLKPGVSTRSEVVTSMGEPAICDGVKIFSDWLTVPQLYVRGEFIGGCDIMKEMYQSGELKALLEGIAAPD